MEKTAFCTEIEFLNEEMIILVDSDKLETAKDITDDAIDKWHDNDRWAEDEEWINDCPIGDYVESMLDDAGIQHEMRFKKSDDIEEE